MLLILSGRAKKKTGELKKRGLHGSGNPAPASRPNASGSGRRPGTSAQGRKSGRVETGPINGEDDDRQTETNRLASGAPGTRRHSRPASDQGDKTARRAAAGQPGRAPRQPGAQGQRQRTASQPGDTSASRSSRAHRSNRRARPGTCAVRRKNGSDRETGGITATDDEFVNAHGATDQNATAMAQNRQHQGAHQIGGGGRRSQGTGTTKNERKSGVREGKTEIGHGAPHEKQGRNQQHHGNMKATPER